MNSTDTIKIHGITLEDWNKHLHGQEITWYSPNGESQMSGFFCGIVPPHANPIDLYPFLKTVRKKDIHFRVQHKPPASSRARVLLAEYIFTKPGDLSQFEEIFYCPFLNTLLIEDSIIIKDSIPISKTELEAQRWLNKMDIRDRYIESLKEQAKESQAYIENCIQQIENQEFPITKIYGMNTGILEVMSEAFQKHNFQFHQVLSVEPGYYQNFYELLEAVAREMMIPYGMLESHEKAFLAGWGKIYHLAFIEFDRRNYQLGINNNWFQENEAHFNSSRI